MLLSRFWFLLLGGLAGAGLAVAAVATSLLDEREDEAARGSIVRDVFELQELLKIDARTRIDAIAPLAANGDVRSALREASGRSAGAEVSEETMNRLRVRLGELNTQLRELAGDLVWGVDSHGIIVAQVGGSDPPRGAGLGAFPAVRRALDGYVRDDVWVWNGEVLRVAVRPVVEGGQYVGAIVHAMRIDDELAQRLSTPLGGASVGFYFRDTMVASAMPSDLPGAPRREDMAGPLATIIESEAFTGGEASEIQTISGGALAIYAPIVGEAAHARVGMVLARPVPVLPGPLAILGLASSDDWQSVPWIPIAGAVVLLFALAMFFVWIEHDRPLARFRETASRLGKRDIDRFVPPEFGGALRSAAASVNEALDKVQESAASAPRRKAADLDEILGKAAPDASSPSFFGFQGGNQSGSSFELPPVPPAAGPPGAPPAPSSPAIPKPPVAAPPAPAPPSPPAAAPAPPAPKPPQPAAPAPPAAAPPAAAARPAQDPLGSTLIGVGVAGAQGSGPVAAPKPKMPMPTPPSGGDDEDDGATMVARVPDELLRAAQTGDEEAHFKEVFQQFLETKRQCGESVTGLTYEKFVVTLRKNKEAIVSKHGASKVRFTVYVKDGKAALKATPIKE